MAATRNELRGFLNLNSNCGGIVKTSRNTDNDELVKHMSKLPGYLQRIERGEESLQSNVLNVGVLDWGRIEKWKHARASCENEIKVSTTSTLGTLPNDSHWRKFDDQVHNSSSNLGKVKASRDLQHPLHEVRSTLELELASRDSLNKQDIGHKLNPVKSSRPSSYLESTSGLLSEMGNSWGSKETQNRAGEIDAPDSVKQCVDGEEKIIGVSKSGSTSEKQENQQFSNIVLLRSRKKSQSNLMSPDDNLKVEREVNLSEDMVSPPLGVDLSGKKERRRRSKTASRIFDQEMSEDESRKNRHPSPSKRFSFSFGRLSRSFTFKEDSAGQTLSSSDDTMKSDSKRFDDSVCPSRLCNLEKQTISHSGSRVSPLRRLLDPLLKPKDAEKVLPPKAKPTNSDIPLQDEKKKDTSRTRALFQLTIRNGIPLFQFVVENNKENNKNILGATMKNSASSLKDDSVQYCTFYSVNEVKKKKRGSWLTHGHKEKQCGFVYNVIGQMRLCNSISSNEKDGKNYNVMRESVLFDGESEQVKGRREVAAVVMEKKRVEENYHVIIGGGVHSYPEKGEPSPLISRWRSGGICDCGGWDVGCKLQVFSNKTFLQEFDQKNFKVFKQEEESGGAALEMREVKKGIYRVEFGSYISPLEAFFVCVTFITCEEEVEEKPFAPPPLSPFGRL